MPMEIQTLAEWEKNCLPDTLSVVIPAHNEAGQILQTVKGLHAALSQAAIQHEIVIINDNSSDETENILKALSQELPEVHYHNALPPHGFGFAVRLGLSIFRGDTVVIVMADGSDSPADVVKFYHTLQQGYDCVFGSRFSRGAEVIDYPWFKLALNRLGNTMIRSLFMFRYNDTTNAFKMYRRKVIAGIQPLLSYHFNLTVELPLKAITRGYSYAVVSNSWYNRKEGVSKFKIKEMGSRYIFIILYCFIEKLLCLQDYCNSKDLNQHKLQVWPK
jgi:dolichol-phosphate mannosyltransferase